MSDWRAEIRKRLTNAGLEPTREIEIVEELAQHLDDRHAELLARGTDPDEAEAAVLAELHAEDVLPRRLRRAAPKDGHRDHGRGDRRGECEPHLQAEVDVRGGEQRGDQRAQEQPAQGELGDPGGGHAQPLADLRTAM
jgi:hypothetical protein